MSSTLANTAGMTSQRRRASIGEGKAKDEQPEAGDSKVSRARARGAELARKLNMLTDTGSKVRAQNARQSLPARGRSEATSTRKSLPSCARKAEAELSEKVKPAPKSFVCLRLDEHAGPADAVAPPEVLVDRFFVSTAASGDIDDGELETSHRVNVQAPARVAAVSLPSKSSHQVLPASMSPKAFDNSPTRSVALDIALRKSELLLAELSNLHLSGNEIQQESQSTTDEGSCPDSLCSTPRAQSEVSDDLPATVEVPVALLDMFFEDTLSNYQNQTAPPSCTSPDGSSQEAQTVNSKVECLDGSQSDTTHVADSESGMLSSKASSVGSSILVSPASSSLTAGSSARCVSPCRASVVQGSAPTRRFLSPNRQRAVSPTVVKACPLVPCRAQMYRQASPPRVHTLPAPKPRTTLMPALNMDVFGGRKPISCKVGVHQTVTITNTVHVTWEVA